eukprot:jgi/Ulvmu1/5652/UM237_0002.1
MQAYVHSSHARPQCRRLRVVVRSESGGIVPQSPAKFVSENTYYLAPWTPQAAVGDGFDRLRCEYKNSAVTATQADKAAPIAKSLNQFVSVVSDSSSYAEAFSASTSASCSGWGASASVSAELATSAEHSSRSVTALLNFQWLAEPFTAIKLNDPSSDAKLQPHAREFLEANGPVAFAEEYGTHFVIGYTMGGALRGHYSAIYNTSAEARSASAMVSVSVNRAVASGSVSGAVSSEVSKTAGFSKDEFRYAATGWSGRLPPQADANLESIISIAKEFDMSQGKQLEALLGTFEDLQDYQDAVKAYEEDGGMEKFAPPDMFLYERAAQVLNHEILAYQYVVEKLENRSHWPQFGSWKGSAEAHLGAAQAGLRALRRDFCRGPSATDNWDGLLAYVDYISAGEGDGDRPPAELEDASAGYSLAQRLFRSRNLVRNVDELLNYTIRYRVGIWAVWTKSGGDSGGSAEVEGNYRIYWADGTNKVQNFERKVHKKNRQRAFKEYLVSYGSSNKRYDTWPVKIRFDPKEDDGSNKSDDDLGTAWVHPQYSKHSEYELGEGTFRAEVTHRKDKFEFKFGCKVNSELRYN